MTLGVPPSLCPALQSRGSWQIFTVPEFGAGFGGRKHGGPAEPLGKPLGQSPGGPGHVAAGSTGIREAIPKVGAMLGLGEPSP